MSFCPQSCCCCCSTAACISPTSAPTRFSNCPPLLPPFCSPSNQPRRVPLDCMTDTSACCPVLRCRASPCNYPNPHYDPLARMCGPVSNCGSCSRAGSGPCGHATCGRYFPSCANGGY